MVLWSEKQGEMKIEIDGNSQKVLKKWFPTNYREAMQMMKTEMEGKLIGLERAVIDTR